MKEEEIQDFNTFGVPASQQRRLSKGGMSEDDSDGSDFDSNVVDGGSGDEPD